ncbi:hypothetical protein [Immundisolibacter sp.]|uniref:hypothetical protein n=1 Tax=Immundisolibacter sp. TaxID=1934948 RepID=UPI00261F82D4|nr:hypothetical protein [Immundisolibacter sp.]MDD3651511.1 hypothetical protein [Immundisolibacter sp.]
MSAALARTVHDPVDRLLSRLECVKQTGADRWIARCPAHNDRRPSLSIRQTDDHRALLHCFAGCAAAEIVHAAGLELRDLYPERPAEHYAGPVHAHSRWSRSDVWLLLQHEAAIAAIVAADTAAGRPVSAEDAERAGLAADRLADAVATLGVR